MALRVALAIGGGALAGCGSGKKEVAAESGQAKRGPASESPSDIPEEGGHAVDGSAPPKMRLPEEEMGKVIVQSDWHADAYEAPKRPPHSVDFITEADWHRAPAGARANTTPLPEMVLEDGTVIRSVYYGTDRMPDWDRGYSRFAWFAGVFAVAGILSIVASRFTAWKKTFFVLSALPFVGTYLSVRAFSIGKRQFLDDQAAENRQYGGELHETPSGVAIERGICEVSIPGTHVRGSGELERPKWYEFRADRERHFYLCETKRIADEDAFLSQFAADVANSDAKQALVFIHGFNVTFREAALRTAQMAYDLRFEGPAAFFSWPSDGRLLSYGADLDDVEATVPQLKAFLVDLVDGSGAESIHIIAHSMGNKALGEMLMDIETVTNSDDQPVLNQVIMAAPDVSAQVFRTKIAPEIRDAARQFTLYASSKDIALLGAEILRKHKGTRLGQGGEDRQVLLGIQTVDATELPGEAAFQLSLQHSYYVNPWILKDIKYLIETPAPPLEREWLEERPHPPSDSYWVFDVEDAE